MFWAAAVMPPATVPFAPPSLGEQADKDLRVGGAPACDRVPAGSCLVAGDRDSVDDHVVARELAGSPVHLLDYDLDGLRRKAGTRAKLGREFWTAVRRDAKVLIGAQLDDLIDSAMTPGRGSRHSVSPADACA
jgi:hypothetical protein